MTAGRTEPQSTAGQFFKALNFVGEFRRRHPDVAVTRPSESRSGMWSVAYGPADTALFSSVELLARGLMQWEDARKGAL